MKLIIVRARDIFEEITCLCSEGQEFMNKIEMAEAICKIASNGYEMCKQALQQENSADKISAQPLLEGETYHIEWVDAHTVELTRP